LDHAFVAHNHSTLLDNGFVGHNHSTLLDNGFAAHDHPTLLDHAFVVHNFELTIPLSNGSMCGTGPSGTIRVGLI